MIEAMPLRSWFGDLYWVVCRTGDDFAYLGKEGWVTGIFAATAFPTRESAEYRAEELRKIVSEANND